MNTTDTTPRFIVMSASAKMPASCWGQYGRIAVVELDGSGVHPKMISERARGVKRIVTTWERLHVGNTRRCAFQRAYAAAQKMAAELNRG